MVVNTPRLAKGRRNSHLQFAKFVPADREKAGSITVRPYSDNLEADRLWRNFRLQKLYSDYSLWTHCGRRRPLPSIVILRMFVVHWGILLWGKYPQLAHGVVLSFVVSRQDHGIRAAASLPATGLLEASESRSKMQYVRVGLSIPAKGVLLTFAQRFCRSFDPARRYLRLPVTRYFFVVAHPVADIGFRYLSRVKTALLSFYHVLPVDTAPVFHFIVRKLTINDDLNLATGGRQALVPNSRIRISAW